MHTTTGERANSGDSISGRAGLRTAISIGVVVILASLALNAYLGWRLYRLGETLDHLKAAERLVVGAQVPEIKARSLDGRESIIEFQKDGRPTLLYFFSPGCETCERNVANIRMLAQQKGGQYRIIGFSLSDEGLESYVKEKDFNFPVYYGLGVEPTLAYRLGRVPQTTLVSVDGKVLANWHGPYNGREREAIESYLGMSFQP